MKYLADLKCCILFRSASHNPGGNPVYSLYKPCHPWFGRWANTAYSQAVFYI